MLYCHAPHSGVGGATPLWNQTLSTQTYTPYTSTTLRQKANPQPPLGQDSSLVPELPRRNGRGRADGRLRQMPIDGSA